MGTNFFTACISIHIFKKKKPVLEAKKKIINGNV